MGNSKYGLLAFLLLFFVYASAAQTGAQPLTIGVTEKFYSAILKETRNINIYVPEGYEPNDTLRYPVIYVLDGGIDEDFLHIVGLVQYNSQPWINRLPKSIVVGIENVNRKRDFTFAVPNTDFLRKYGFKQENIPSFGGSANYIAFLQKELQPLINARYKTNGDQTVIGESLAGLLSTEILLKSPDLFDTYIIISPSLWWGDETLLKEADSSLKAGLRLPVKVYIAAPKREEDVRMYDEAQKLSAVLKLHQSATSFFDYLPGEVHATVLHQAVYNAFKKLYPISRKK